VYSIAIQHKGMNNLPFMSPLSGILIVILCGLDFQSPEFYYIRGGKS
jgi:hypothetical protein